MLWALLVALTLGTPGAARAEWRRSSEIDWGTAYTLDAGSLSVGVLSPLVIGVTDALQVAVHPILLLVGKPSFAMRYRVTPIGRVTTSIDLAGAWSFIRRVDLDGLEPAPDSGEKTGFPGSLQLTSNTTFALGDSWLLTAGVGGAIDFLDGSPERHLLAFMLALHWLPGARHLVMLQLSSLLDPASGGELVRPSAQILYAWAASARVQLGAGLALGRFNWELGPGRSARLAVFPVVDAWFRF
jgi:hypothetical protein